MASIYETDHGRLLLLYPRGHQILFQNMGNEPFRHSTVLSSDYFRDFDSILYKETIHYIYQNTKHQLMVNTLSTEQRTLYQTEPSGEPVLSSPQLILFQQNLLLFYFLYHPMEQQFTAHAVFPYHPERSLILSDAFTECPSLLFFEKKKHLHIELSVSDREEVLLLSPDLQIKKIPSFHAVSKEMNPRAEKASLKDKTDQKDKTNQKEQLNQMKQELTTARETISEQTREIKRLHSVIQSAVRQYNDLMQVASQYRDEAVKWHNKFVN